MKLDIPTLAIVSCLIFLAQFIVLFVQYTLNKSDHKVRWWLMGLALWALGVIFMPMVNIKPLETLARVANPLVVSSAVALMAAARLFINKDKPISGSANFTALAFFAYGIFCAFRIGWLLFSPSIQNYTDTGMLLVLGFIVPIVTSLLWTFGFIILLNQRLNAENHEEKEKMQLIIHTNPDAAVI